MIRVCGRRTEPEPAVVVTVLAAFEASRYSAGRNVHFYPMQEIPIPRNLNSDRQSKFTATVFWLELELARDKVGSGSVAAYEPTPLHAHIHLLQQPPYSLRLRP
jgi:hypothetical protein